MCFSSIIRYDGVYLASTGMLLLLLPVPSFVIDLCGVVLDLDLCGERDTEREIQRFYSQIKASMY